MEEKIIVKSGKTAVKKSFVFILILMVLIAVMCPMHYSIVMDYATDEVIEHAYYGERDYGYHDYECFNAKGKALYNRYEGDPERTLFMEEDDEVNTSNCKYSKYKFLFVDLTPLTLLMCTLIVLLIIYICLTRCKYFITETNIYGKKGYKKFDITFSDIIEITQKGKSLTLKTENSQLKLSPLKNCEEIYNYIKPFVSERKVEQPTTKTEASTNAVDDIKLF